MEEFLRGGGSLLIFVGDQVTAESLSTLHQRGLLPGRVAEEPVEGRIRVDRWDAKHAALACFSDPQQGDLRRLEFHKLLPLEQLEGDSVELFGCGNQIAAAERRVGKGKCVYVGTSVDRDWTELPRTPMYVPLMPIFAVQPYGRGRTFAFAPDTTAAWDRDFESKWGEGDNRYFRLFYRNAVR